MRVAARLDRGPGVEQAQRLPHRPARRVQRAADAQVRRRVDQRVPLVDQGAYAQVQAAARGDHRPTLCACGIDELARADRHGVAIDAAAIAQAGGRDARVLAVDQAVVAQASRHVDGVVAPGQQFPVTWLSSESARMLRSRPALTRARLLMWPPTLRFRSRPAVRLPSWFKEPAYSNARSSPEASEPRPCSALTSTPGPGRPRSGRACCPACRRRCAPSLARRCRQRCCPARRS